MSLLTRAELLKPAGRRYRVVPLPTGGQVRIQSLTSGEARALRQFLLNPKGELIKVRGDRLAELLICACLVDENGQRLFSQDDAMSADFDAFDNAVSSVLYQFCRNWTGFAADPDFAAIEDAVKNSESTPTS